MIFASDLDQTMIYSKRAFRLKEGTTEPSIRLIETYEGREISFMTSAAIELLKEVHEKMTFLPVTTRTIKQFQRITLFQEEIIPDMAVTSNGGNILVKGQADQDWQRLIRRKMNESSMSPEDLKMQFSELAHDNWILSERTADELFHYYIIDQAAAPLEELKDFEKAAAEAGWKMSLQGRKLYFVPMPVNKWDAVAHIKEKMGKTFVAAAGDSLLDLCMLEVADLPIAPLHGELNDAALGKTILRTENRGLLAAEDILKQVLAAYEKNKKICAS
ncbi:HAD family hydrolase [Peribacillus psychrosaccharolyticus]|uniref:HAD family hydrolase n=1 Tax=Peribacillus psychrosaccharolyticus TaxID=1407 RepID=UPI003D2A1EAA